MNKRVAQTTSTVEFKKREINDALKGALNDLNKKMQDATRQLGEQTTKELNSIVNNLTTEVNTKVNELKSLVPAQTTTQTVTQPLKDQLPGGKGHKLKLKNVDKNELKMGIEVELEHTNSRELAKEIALDHLAEDPKYYTNLKKVHKESIYDLPGVVKDGGKKKKKQKRKTKQKGKHSLEPMPEHPTPRGPEHTKGLPPFWRRNFDYGESPYMNIGFIEKITDKPPIKKKKKKSEVIIDLIRLADYLDKVGLRNAANRVDILIKNAVEKWEYYGLEPPKDPNAKMEQWQYYGYSSPEEYDEYRKRMGLEPQKQMEMPKREVQETPHLRKGPTKEQVQEVYKKCWPKINEFLNIAGDFAMPASNIKQRGISITDEVILEYSSREDYEKAKELIESHGFMRGKTLPNIFSKSLGDGFWIQLTKNSELKDWEDNWSSSIGVLKNAPPSPKLSIELSIHENRSDIDGAAFYEAVDQAIGKEFPGMERGREDWYDEDQFEFSCKNCGLTQVSDTPYCYNCGQRAPEGRW